MEKFWHCRRDKHSEIFDTKLEEALVKAQELNQIKLGIENSDGLKVLEKEQISAFTLCIMEDENRKELARGYSFCSNKDQFSKRKGRLVSKQRALYKG